MRKQIIYILAAAIMTAGCAEKETVQGPKGFGSFRVVCSANPDITTEIPDANHMTRADVIPSGNAFTLTLTGEGYTGKWATVADFAAADTMFLEGPYKAVIAYGDPEEEGFGKPYYQGEADFSIQALVYDKPIQVTAQIANSLVVVRATESFLKYFHDAQFTVTTASANDFAFAPGATDYTGAATYVKAETSLKLTGTARRQSQTGTNEGLPVTFEEQTLDATQPRTKHIFLFDAKNTGSATLDIFIGTDENGEDKYVETRLIAVELNGAAIPDPEA